MTDHAALCGGVVGHSPSACTQHEGHGGLCEWQRQHEARLPDGTGLIVTTFSDGGVQLAVMYPDGSRTYGSMPERKQP